RRTRDACCAGVAFLGAFDDTVSADGLLRTEDRADMARHRQRRELRIHGFVDGDAELVCGRHRRVALELAAPEISWKRDADHRQQAEVEAFGDRVVTRRLIGAVGKPGTGHRITAADERAVRATVADAHLEAAETAGAVDGDRHVADLRGRGGARGQRDGSEHDSREDSVQRFHPCGSMGQLRAASFAEARAHADPSSRRGPRARTGTRSWSCWWSVRSGTRCTTRSAGSAAWWSTSSTTRTWCSCRPVACSR